MKIPELLFRVFLLETAPPIAYSTHVFFVPLHIPETLDANPHIHPKFIPVYVSILRAEVATGAQLFSQVKFLNFEPTALHFHPIRKIHKRQSVFEINEWIIGASPRFPRFLASLTLDQRRSLGQAISPRHIIRPSWIFHTIPLFGASFNSHECPIVH